MRKTTLASLLVFILVLSTIGGCKSSHNDSAPAQPTTAIIEIMSQGTATRIGGIEVTVVLPSGVTVKATPDVANPTVLVTDAGVVTASGVAAGVNTMTIGTYSAASSGSPGKVMVEVANPDGFGTGEFVTIACDIAAGSFPAAGDFSLTDFLATNLSGTLISGVTAGFTADIH